MKNGNNGTRFHIPTLIIGVGIVLSFGAALLAGTGTLSSVSGGVVRTSHVNQYYSALNQDFVPRNSSGVATADGGDLGTSTYYWNDVFLGGGAYFPSSSKWKISKDGSDNLDFDFNGTTRLSVTSGGAVTYTSNGNALGQQISSSSGSFSTTSATAVDVTNLSVTISSTGRPIMVFAVSDGTGSVSRFGASRAAAGFDTGLYISIERNGSEIWDSQLSVTGANYAGRSVYHPPGIIHTIDAVAAGTYTYKIRARVFYNPDDTAVVENIKLVAYEL